MTSTVRPHCARLNFAVFAIAAIGAGWVGVAVDRNAKGELANGIALSDSSGSGGQALFILLPAAVGLALFFFSRDGAGPLGLTLRFAHRTRWFTSAIATALVYGEFRVQTGSIWPGVALHTMSNAVVTPLLTNGHLRFAGHGDVLFSPVPNSIGMVLLFGVVGVLMARRRTRERGRSQPVDRRADVTTGGPS